MLSCAMLRTLLAVAILGTTLFPGAVANAAEDASGDTMSVRRMRAKPRRATRMETVYRLRLNLRIQPTAELLAFDPKRDEIGVQLGLRLLADSATGGRRAALRRRAKLVTYWKRSARGRVSVRLNLRSGRCRVVARNVASVTGWYGDDGTVATLTVGDVRYHANFRPEYDFGDGKRAGWYLFDGAPGDAVPPPPEPGEQLSFRRIVSEFSSGRSGGAEEFREARSFADRWQRHGHPGEQLPFVDFETETAFYVNLGGRADYGYLVEVTAVIARPTGLEIQFTELVPCGGSGQGSSTAFALIAVERTDTSVVIVSRTAQRCRD